VASSKARFVAPALALLAMRASLEQGEGGGFETGAANVSARVPDLGERAFRVYENGKLQRITLFRRDDIPVSAGLLIDNSGSVRTLRGRV